MSSILDIYNNVDNFVFSIYDALYFLGKSFFTALDSLSS